MAPGVQGFVVAIERGERVLACREIRPCQHCHDHGYVGTDPNVEASEHARATIAQEGQVDLAEDVVRALRLANAI